MASSMRNVRKLVQPFHFKPFSHKQLKILTWWTEKSPYKDHDVIIADGSIRSGKTVSMALSFALWAMTTFNGQNFGICGKTIFSCRRNVVEPLKKMLLSRGYEVTDIRNENMLIISGEVAVDGQMVSVVNYFYMFGGKDESSQDLIQGITLAGLFCDEVALMMESFVNQATGRCSVTGSKIWFSCNPSNPNHFFKVQWIDKTDAKKILYLHFTMDDNPSLSPQVRKRYESMYSGVFRKRYIEGLWVTADGLVYPMFNKEKHLKEMNYAWDRVFVAGDYGVYNATTFGVYGYIKSINHYHLIESYYHSGRESEAAVEDISLDSDFKAMSVMQKTTKEYADDLVSMIEPYFIKYIILDPSAAAMIVELQKHPYIRKAQIDVIPAKNDVMLGIAFHSDLLNRGKFTMDPSNIHDVNEYHLYSWDAKKSEHGKDEVIKTHDHCMDRNRYACLTDALLNDNFGFDIEIFSGRGARL